MSRRPPLPLACALLALACASQPEGKSAEPPAFPALPGLFMLGFDDLPVEVADRRAPSGFRLMHQSVAGSGVAAVAVVVGVGGGDDPAGKEGLAHLVEHLVFRARAGSDSFTDRLRALGATGVNGFTDHDTTTYVAVVPRAALPELLKLEAELVTAPLAGVTEAVFAIERDVVRNELRERDENGAIGQLAGTIEGALFPPQHRYARPIGGSHESLLRLTLADAQAFAASQYRPGNVSLSVVGDVSLTGIKDAVQGLPRALIGDREHRATPPPPPASLAPLEPPAPPAAAPLLARKAPVNQPELWIGWSLPGSYGAYANLGDVLRGVLDREGEALVADDPDVIDIDFFRQPGVLADVLYGRVRLLRTDRAQQISAKIAEAIRALWAKRLNQDPMFALEVGSTVLSAASGVLLEAEDLLPRAMNVARFAHLTGDPRSYPATLDGLVQVDSKRVAYFAFAYLKPERARTVLFEPEARDAPLPLGALDRPAPRAPRLVPAAARPTVAQLSALPSTLGAGGVRTFRLANGLKVMLWPRPGFPVVAAALGFYGGRAHADPRVAELFLGHPAATHLPYCTGWPWLRGLSVMPVVSEDVSYDVSVGGAGNLSAILATLAERAVYFRRDRWPALKSLAKLSRFCSERDLDKEQAEYWSKLRQTVTTRGLRRASADALDPEVAGRRALIRGLAAGTPYFAPMPESDVKGLSVEQLRGWVERSRVPGNAFLIIVGAMEPVHAEQMVRGWFESWQPAAGPPPAARPVAPPAAAPPVALTVPRPGATLVEASLGCAVEASDERRSVTNRLLVAYLAEQLQRRLRQEMGATYHVSPSLSEVRGGLSMLLLHTSIENARVRPALAAWHELASELAAGRIDEGALGEVRWDLARADNRSRTAASLLGRLVGLEALGREPAELDRFGWYLSAVTTEELVTAFKACRARQGTALIGDPGVMAAATKTEKP